MFPPLVVSELLPRAGALPGFVSVVLLISGSTRAGSTNTAVLRTVQTIAPTEIEARWYGGLTELPAFVPGDGVPESAAVRELRVELARGRRVVLHAGIRGHTARAA
ncbi:hypothetical protein [Nocardia paucivorans]|uniref:hypothetical protein n=1 Tax=Nocardia paucivorans TaxID=114259 RepID=UPI00031F7BA6|nr:hypothetical protein [Nocardia paucivorans]